MNGELFYCYSPKLKGELQQLGFQWKWTNKHKITNKVFWVYDITTELKTYLINRRDNKNK